MEDGGEGVACDYAVQHGEQSTIGSHLRGRRFRGALDCLIVSRGPRATVGQGLGIVRSKKAKYEAVQLLAFDVCSSNQDDRNDREERLKRKEERKKMENACYGREGTVYPSFSFPVPSSLFRILNINPAKLLAREQSFALVPARFCCSQSLTRWTTYTQDTERAPTRGSTKQ